MIVSYILLRGFWKMAVKDDVVLGENVTIFQPSLVNIYGCRIGSNTKIGAFVEIQSGADIGELCKIQSHSFICEGVTLEKGVFVGHGVMFINDRYPASSDGDKLLEGSDWSLETTLVKEAATIGSGSVIMCGITIGKGAMIGAGSVVTKDVPDYAIVKGVPGRVSGDMRERVSRELNTSV